MSVKQPSNIIPFTSRDRLTIEGMIVFEEIIAKLAEIEAAIAALDARITVLEP